MRLVSRAGLLALLALVASLSPACSGQPTDRSPDEVLAALRTAVASRDVHGLFALYDRESKGFYRASAREWKARLARGDSAADVLGAEGPPVDEVTGSTVEEVAAKYAAQYTPLLESQGWLAGATETGERKQSGPDGGELVLHLEGQDGKVRDFWFVREADGWAYDHYRTDIR